jgi:hypothetical protein
VHENNMPAGMPEDGIASWKEAPPVVLTEKDSARADA